MLSLATAKRVSELQALSRSAAFCGKILSLSYLPEFVAKTESERNPLPRSFLVRSLEEFVGGFTWWSCTVSGAGRPCVFAGCGGSASSSAYFICILELPFSVFVEKCVVLFHPAGDYGFWGGGWGEGISLHAHSVRGIATSVSFMRNWLVSRVLEAATWRSNLVFA